MSKEQYLRKLRSLIHALPAEERRRVIDFYREIMEDKIESGKTEQQAIAELGDVFMLAQKILAENPNRKQYNGNRIAGIAVASFFAVLIIAGLVFNGLKVSNQWPDSGNVQSSAQDRGPSEQKKETAPVSGVTKITVDAENKDVTVEQGEGDQISITYWTDNSQTYTFSNQNGEVSLINRDRFKWNFFNFFNFSASGHYKIQVTVPKSYAGELYLHSSNGQTSVSSLEQLTKLTCETSNASVRLNQVKAGNVVLNTSNGQVQMTDTAASSVNASSSNGAIVFSGLTSPDISFDTSNGGIRGDIVGKETDYTIRTDTSNGSCTPGSRSGGSKQLKADTSNASIRITFSESN